MVTQTYTISTVKNSVPPKVKMSQYDSASRTITFTVVDASGAEVDLTGKAVTVEGTRIDGHAFASECTVSEATATFTETVDMTNQAGDHPAELVIRENGERLGTMNFIVSVEPAAMDEDAEITEEDQSLFDQLYTSIDDAVAEVDTAKDEALAKIEQGLASGSPLVANIAAEMTDTDEVYLYTGSESGYTAGSWYYYNGTAWVVGGVYGSGQTDATLTLSGVAADAKATGDAIDELKSDVTQMENTLVIYDEQFLDNTRYEQRYYWFNSAGNINKTYNKNGTAYYAYPKIVLSAGTYYINYVPSNFGFLKTVSSGTVVTIKSVTTNGSFTISEDTEFYLTVYDTTGATHPTVMLANAALPQSYIYGKYNYRFKYVTVDTLTFANGNNSIRTVGVGGDYDSISSACSDAVSGDIILILPGIYTEQISIWGKKLHLIGLDKKLCTIIDHSGEYDTPPIEMNIGTLANLTIIEDGASPSADSDGLAYCVHNDNYLNTDGETLEIVNCDMVNDVHACIGFGMYANYTVKIRNCTMRSNAVKDSAYKRGALYFHANSGQNIAGQKFVVENCIVSSADTLAVYAGVPGGGTGDFTVRFSGNQIWSDTNGTSNDAASISESNTFILDSGSTGNSIAKLNNVTPRQGSKYSVTVNASSSAVINNKRNRIAQGGVFEFCAVSEDRSSYDTGIIKWDADGVLVIEQKNLLCNVTFSTANGDLRVWNRDAVNNHTYSVSIKPF